MMTRASELLQASALTAAANERLSLALEATGLSVWDWDILTGKLEFQPPITEMLGFPCDDGPKHSEGRDLTHPDDVQIFDDDFRAHAAGLKPRMDAEIRMRHADGGWRWVHCHGEIVARAADGSPSRAVGTLADVTERHQDRSDRQFLSDLTLTMVQSREPSTVVSAAIKSLAKHLGAERVGISELTEDGTSLLTRAVWSDRSLPAAPSNHRTAYTPEMIDICLAGTVIVEDVRSDPRMANAVIQELYQGMDIRTIVNVPLRAADRNSVFFFVNAREPRKWSPREVDLIQQVAERLWDSVNRASAEGIRESSDELLGMAFDVAQIGAFERDMRTGEIRVSKDFHKIIGHPEMLSGSLAEYLTIVHPDDRERFADKIAASRQLREEYELSDEHRIVTQNGEIRYISYRSRTHYEKDETGVNRLMRAAAIIQDVTKQRRQEAEASAARDRLNKMSRLTAMGTMASTLAHELNQPLTAAANYLSVLKTLEQTGKTLPDIDRAEVLDLAVRKVLDAGKIIKKIRSFTTDGDVQRHQVSIRKLVNHAVSSLNDLPGRKWPEISVNVPDKLTVVADEMQIEQVLINLIRNAAEAMNRQKNARIDIEATVEDGTVEIHVRDNGPGIADDFAADLFNPFQSSKRTGLGLGLSLCRTMVEAHGGNLTLEKHDKTGCDFLIRLPQTQRRRDNA